MSQGSGYAVKRTWIQIPAPLYSIQQGKAVGERSLSEEPQVTVDAWAIGLHGIVRASVGLWGN